MNEKIVTRFPPSPTGLLQAGNVRTALFNYLFARKHQGRFILRIEDTDKERSKKEYEDNILETLQWLGLTYDEFYRQSERLPRHQEVLRDFIARDVAYRSQEEPKEPGQRSEVIRFRNPHTTVTFTDIIRGPITFDTKELGDFIIARSADEPLYHLGVVIDDFDSGVTHVIRGEDHISNTPRQMLLQRALGQLEHPVYAHLPLLLGPDRSRLSKRKGAKAITQYREEGYLPEALINYLALLGWHPGGEQELFTLDELVGQFDIGRVQKGGAIFDEMKLRWFNHEHLKNLPKKKFVERLRTLTSEKIDEKLVPLLRERAETLRDAVEALESGEYSFLEREAAPDRTLLLQGAKADAATVKIHLIKICELLETLLDNAFSAEQIKTSVFPYATEQGRASVLWPMRVALSGKEKSPDPFTIAALLGKKMTLERLRVASRSL